VSATARIANRWSLPFVFWLIVYAIPKHPEIREDSQRLIKADFQVRLPKQACRKEVVTVWVIKSIGVLWTFGSPVELSGMFVWALLHRYLCETYCRSTWKREPAKVGTRSHSVLVLGQSINGLIRAFDTPCLLSIRSVQQWTDTSLRQGSMHSFWRGPSGSLSARRVHYNQ
jgi:hypothetical protein